MENKSLSYLKHFLPDNYVLVVGLKIKTLKISTYVNVFCPSCQTHHDKDINASINLKNEAIKLLTIRTAEIV